MPQYANAGVALTMGFGLLLAVLSFWLVLKASNETSRMHHGLIGLAVAVTLAIGTLLVIYGVIAIASQ